MSMNFLEALGYVAQGAIEKDDEIRKLEVQRLLIKNISEYSLKNNIILICLYSGC